jgi:hypothetical protein
MLRRIEPMLDEEFPLLPGSMRGDILADLPFRAGEAEACFVHAKHLLTPETRVTLWSVAMRTLVKEIMARVVEVN